MSNYQLDRVRPLRLLGMGCVLAVIGLAVSGGPRPLVVAILAVAAGFILAGLVVWAVGVALRMHDSD